VCLGCDTVKKSVDDWQGKGGAEEKGKEKPAVDRPVAEEPKPVKPQPPREVAAPEPAKQEEAAKVSEVDATGGVIEMDNTWSDDASYAQAILVVKKYLKHPAGARFAERPYVLAHDNNVYRIRSSAHATSRTGQLWAADWQVDLTSIGGKFRVDKVWVDGKEVYVKPLINPGGITEASETERKQSEQESKAAKAEQRKAAAEANRPTAAASMLKIAQKFQEDGKKDTAQTWFRKVVDKYPETEAAAEARTLLGEPAPAKLVSAAKPKLRKWTNKSGTKTIEAEFVSSGDGKVTLKQSDGKVVTIAVKNLSEDDQEFIRLHSGP
jgi:hypothetical protein